MRNLSQAFCASGAVARFSRFAHPVHMAKGGKPAHFIRQWRKFRGYTLENLAERIGMTHQNLGKIERFKVPYTQHLLEHLAEHLRCEPVDIIIRDPTVGDMGIWSIWDELKPTQQRVVVELAQSLKRTGTDG